MSFVEVLLASRSTCRLGRVSDVGMSQIYKFEAKLSQGAAERVFPAMSTECVTVWTFFRLLSFYYGGIGHYLSNVLTILTVIVVVYLMAVLAIF
jgi:callose synthase